MYDYDSNEIISEPIKNMQAETIRDDFLSMEKFQSQKEATKNFI